MATFRKRGDKWRVEVRKQGVYDSASFGSKLQAREWAHRREVEIETGENFDPVEKTLLDALSRYSIEVSGTKKGARWERIRLEAFKKYPVADMSFARIKAPDIAEWRDARLRQVKPSTVNRELNLLSSVFSVAQREWHWSKNNPVKEIKRPRNPKPRDRRISSDEIDRCLLALGYEGAVHNRQTEIAVIFLIALETAMRLGEICGLSWADIDLDSRFVRLEDTKNSTRREVPLSREAVRLFGLLGNNGGKCFAVAPGSASTLFRRAVHNAEINDLRFHDSRHEGLTRLARKLDVLDLARMVGHRDPRSLMIYYNPTATEIALRLD